ncbi:MAG: LPP20 family lipoprotein [Gammaproteobacteria bacterium]|nr:LPP20 family lipoprotein [Gammaproteobacteria bacterium]
MKTASRIIFTGALGFVLAACAGGDTRPAAPDWLDGSAADYPASSYLTGIGSGDTRDAARDRARADLAKTFRVKIDESASDVRNFSRGADGDSYSQEINRELNVQTEQVLEGVTVPEVWQDPATRQFHALAVLERARASLRLRQEIQSLDAGADAMLAAARRSDDVFEKASIAVRVVENQRRRAVVQSMLQAVDATGRGTPPRWPLGQLESDLRTALSRITLEPVASDEWKGLLAGSLGDSGFSLSPDGTYQASLEVETAELPKRQGWFWKRAVVSLRISGPGGESLGQQRWEIKESAADPQTVNLRVRQKVADILENEGRDAILGTVRD